MSRRDKSIQIILLITVMFFMSVAYASLSFQLNISGSTKVSGSRWSVEITELDLLNITGAAKSLSADFTLNSVSFETELQNPGDSITYKVVVKNKGSLDAILQSVDSNIDLLAEDQHLKYELHGAEIGSALAKGEEKEIMLVISCEVQSETNLEQQLNINLNYVQN